MITTWDFKYNIQYFMKKTIIHLNMPLVGIEKFLCSTSGTTTSGSLKNTKFLKE